MSFRFAPLRIITGYSFLQSGLTIDKVKASIKKNDFYGAGISDYGVLYGVPSFIEAMESIDRKYIVGLSVSLEDDYVLYALNEEGYKNLIFISLLVNEDKLDYEELKKHLKGILMVLETNHGSFKQNFKEGFNDKYLLGLAKLSSIVDYFYLGIEATSKDEFDVAQEIRKFAKDHSYECIAFPRIQYQNKEDAIILRIVNAIERDEKIEVKEEIGQRYFMTFNNYQKIYTKAELENTVKVIDLAKFNFHQKRGEIVHFPVNNAAETLRNETLASLKSKGLDDEKHIERLNHELDVIIKMGYEDYFLIVSDYVKYAKNNDILVGPGRGSAAGSLVAFLLDITEVDPLDFDLQFERFLNIARKTMPDIDVDFMDTKRDDMVQYLRDKYGEEKVANITTFQTIQAKQALRDIGRIYDFPTKYIDMLSKAIPEKASLREAYKTAPAFKDIVDSDKDFLGVVALASKIEGLPRQAGLHAAGVILNNVDIKDVLPVTLDLNDHYTSQYEKDYLENQGFLKMDFLALRNLTTIDICLKLIKENKGQELSFYSLPYEDPNIFKTIASGMTAGIFQLESSGMKGAIKLINPTKFEDIYTLLAIYRPGPMDNIKEFVKRKNGKIKVTYLNKELEKVLSPTYGVIIYQEQINQIATVMAGFTLSEADIFRRAVSHKEKEVLLSAQKDFINGALKKGYSLNDAKKVFSDILKFANYGFNKSHAVVYAMIACRMAYLKYYYPLEFYTSLLESSSGANDAKFNEYVSEMSKRNLKIYSPDINESDVVFKIKEGGLLFPLNFIRGINDMMAHSIIDERMMNGDFTDFFDFVKRMFKQGATEVVLTKLINAGAFDKIYPSRASLRATLKYALQFAELSYGQDGQIILDATLDSQKQYFKEEDDPLENLELENEVLSIMLSDNPLRYKKELLKKEKVISLVDAKETTNNVNIAGIISSIKIIKTRKAGTTMAFIKIFDEFGELEVTIFPRIYETAFSILAKNKIVLVNGHYEINGDRESFVAESIRLLEEE